jgi:hypothetical protein
LSLTGQDFFTPKKPAQIFMTQDKQDQIQKLNLMPKEGDLSYASIKDFNTWCSNTGVATFTVPGTTTTLQASAMHVNYISNQEYTYIGKIDGDANANFAITRNEEGFTGFIWLSQDRYFMYPLGGDEVVVIKDADLSPSEAAGNDCGTATAVSEVPPNPALSSSDCDLNNDCYALIDILLLIHPNVGNNLPTGFNSMATVTTNAILLNSGIINKEVRTRIFNLPSNITVNLSSNDASGDLDNFRSNPLVQQFRDNTGSDITILISGSTWNLPGNNSIVGIAYTDASNSHAYGIVNANRAFGNLVFAHEVGHIFGALHHRTQNPQTPPNPLLEVPFASDDAACCAHGYVFTGSSGSNWATILSRGGPRIPYYSNPSVNYDGSPTGISGGIFFGINNAGKIKNRACSVDNFRLPTRLYSQITGPMEMCPGDNILYGALVTFGTNQGQTPANYIWEVSTNPNGPYLTLATMGSGVAWVHANLGIPGQYMYLKLTTIAQNGFQHVTTKRILVHGTCLGNEGDDRSVQIDLSDFNGRSELILNPNPANDRVQILLM